jgi:hypothetical protein
MSIYRTQVALALRAATIRGPTRYAWLGRTSRPLPALLEAGMNSAELRGYLVSCLQEELYWSFYSQGRPVPARWGAAEPIAADLRLEAALSEANAGHGTWERGWTFERLEDDQAIVTTQRLRTRVPVADCRGLDDDLGPGAAVGLRLPNEMPSLSPGFHTVLGDAVAEPRAWSGLVRVYWNVGPMGAAALVSILTSLLNAKRVPFRLKVANHPRRMHRCDAAVLYLPADAFSDLREKVGSIATAHATALGPHVPAFTLELAPGVGLAEDVVARESFGERRCAILAEAIVHADEQAIAGDDERCEVVVARFEESGIDIDAPYLEPSLEGRHVL